ncbi:MAG: uroporphyrinogen decarboxylase family protein, partial [Treponema sp.]|nr:uroporphyrinogen decarboxylase family protein [Treponema sp.]
DDTAALLSPNLYREFGLKYNAMLAKEFGGIVVHSCGDVSNVAEAMMEIPGLKGLDFTIPQVQNWEKVRDAVAGKTALCLRHFYWDHLDDGVTDFAGYTKKLIDCFGRKGVFIQTSAPTHEEAVKLGEEMHKVLSK